jgi:hypothetical protein
MNRNIDLMDIDSWYYCPCMCHKSSSVKHCIPCCIICPICKQGIVGNINKHIYEIHDKEE